jgi:hypothetical protein
VQSHGGLVREHMAVLPPNESFDMRTRGHCDGQKPLAPHACGERDGGREAETPALVKNRHINRTYGLQRRLLKVHRRCEHVHKRTWCTGSPLHTCASLSEGVPGTILRAQAWNEERTCTCFPAGKPII